MKEIKIIHFVSGIGNDGVAQVLTNYTGRMNKHFPIKESIVYQHEANQQRLKLEQNLGNKTYRIPFKVKHPVANLVATYRLIQKIKPDIVEAHMNLVNFFPLFIAWILHVPVRISHSHIAQDADNINPKLAPIFKKLNIMFSTNLVACGEKAGKYMYGNKKFHIVYNAIDQNKYQFNDHYREEIRKKYNISESTMVLGNIGRITKQKNQKFLIDIFSEYLKINPNSILFIIGNGELSKELNDYINKKKCNKKVIRINGVTSTEKFYSAFDVFLLPSLYEGLPVVAIEAQTNGLLTLLSDSIDKDVSFNNGKTFFMSVNNGTGAWIKKLNYTKFDIHARQESYSKNYDINCQYKFLFHYYQKLIRRNKI